MFSIRNSFSVLCLCALGVSLSPLSAQNTNIVGLFDTGQGDAPGFASTHYSLASAPAGSGLTTAYVTSSFPSVWTTTGFGSATWISPVTNANNDVPAGVYDYRLTFTLINSEGQALNPNATEIQGIWATDNTASLMLNGVVVGTNSAQFVSSTSFDLTTGFQSGINTLDFLVDNSPGSVPNPSGLIVRFLSGAGAIQTVPEPATSALIGSAFLLAAWWRSKKSQP